MWREGMKWEDIEPEWREDIEELFSEEQFNLILRMRESVDSLGRLPHGPEKDRRSIEEILALEIEIATLSVDYSMYAFLMRGVARLFREARLP